MIIDNINWLLRAGQTRQGPEDFLRRLCDCSSYDPMVPAEIFCSFGVFYAIREEIIRGVPASEFFKRFSDYWPSNFVLPEEVRSLSDYAKVLAANTEDAKLSTLIREEAEKADPLKLAREFLEGLRDFIEDIKQVVQGNTMEIRYVSARVVGNTGFTVTNGIISSSGHVLKISALGPDTLVKLLNGRPSIALKICPQCEKLFFNLSKRRMFCSQECNSKSKYKKRIVKADYYESRRLISRKYYLKREKFMTETEIAQIWRSEGIGEKWIKRLLPEAS